MAFKRSHGMQTCLALCLAAHCTSQALGQLQEQKSNLLPAMIPDRPPPGVENLKLDWFRINVPTIGTMRAAVARPEGPGPFPAIVLLHGTHGFARNYLEWASELSKAGYVALAACWFSGGITNEVTAPVPCPDLPPLGAGEYPNTVPLVAALVHTAGQLSGVQPGHIALIGHSRGAGAAQQYLMAGGKLKAAVLHSSGYAQQPWNRAGDFNLPILIMHGTNDTFGTNTAFNFARRFESSLRELNKQVETAYCEGCTHNSFFTNRAQHIEELNHMLDFLRRHLSR